MEQKKQKTGLTKSKRITYTAILAAVYVVLSVLIKIPVAGHITLDMGYIALMVAIVCLGPVPAMEVGAIGAALESLMTAQRGISPGWILMNAIIGLLCGYALQKVKSDSGKQFILAAIFSVFGAALLGIAVKTAVDCLLYSLPLAPKIVTGLIAWVLDSLVMLLCGLPLSMTLKKRNL